MKILAISGSTRQQSTNTALLRAIKATSPAGIVITVYDGIGNLPVFSPDNEGPRLPDRVKEFMQMIADSDGILISSPEYVRGIPGGLKNAIDWLVSGDQIVSKPIALVHASHRGDDMLAALRAVLSTISNNFNEELFLRFPFMKETPLAILKTVEMSENRQMIATFIRDFSSFCQSQSGSTPRERPID